MCGKGGGKLVKNKTANSMGSIMDFSSILDSSDLSFFFFLPHALTPDLSSHSPLLLSQRQTAHQLCSITIQQPSNIYVFSQIASSLCYSLIHSFLLSLYTPRSPATPSVHQKFTLPDSTKPFERQKRRKCSKDM